MSKKVLWLHTGDMNLEPVVGSLAAVKDFDLEVEEYVYSVADGTSFFDEDLALAAAESKPDICLYIGPLAGPHLPRPHVFTTIREFCPIAHLVFDGACPDSWPALKRYREDKCFNVTVNIDGNQDWPKGENDMTMLCPINPDYYEIEPPVEKSVAVGFYGGSTSDDRKELLSALGDHITTVERNETPGSYREYANNMLITRAIVNMAKTGTEKAMHVKARVIEAGLARCLLLEPKGSPTKNYFKPMEDYMEYENAKDLKEIINWVRLTGKTQHFADNLYKRVTEEHSPEIFFRKLFTKMGVSV